MNIFFGLLQHIFPCYVELASHFLYQRGQVTAVCVLANGAVLTIKD